MGVLKDAPPVSYQMIDGARVPVESRYVLKTEGTAAKTRYGFAVGALPRGRELIIDPGLDYSTFLGGASDEMRRRHPGRRGRQRLYRRLDAVAQLPDDGRRVRPNRRASNNSRRRSSAS